MDTLTAVAAGVAIALIGSCPVIWPLELGLRHDRRASIALGLVGVLVSFVMSSALLLAASMLLADDFAVGGVAYVAALTVLWLVEAIRAHGKMS